MLETTVAIKPGYVLVTAKGEFDLESAIDAFPAAVVACRKSGLDAVLVDFRDIQDEIVFTQEIAFAIGVSDTYRQHLATGGRPLRLAFLGAPNQIRSWSPGQELAAENGLDTLLTDDKVKALRWLGSQEG